MKGKAFDFWIEVKGYWPSSERSKMLAVIQRHPTLPIFIALQRPHMRISKTSKTSYCMWCEKIRLGLVPYPIPDDFLHAWVTGQRLIPCPDTEGCGSSDGAAINSDNGSIYCFACGQHFMNTDNKPDPLAGYGSSRMDAAETQVETPLPAGTYCELSDRGIGQSTCRQYDYQSGLKNGRPAHFAHVKDQQGRNVATHIRTLPKHISWKGSPKGTQLFGQHIGSGSHLIITEGEIDAMSVYEAYCVRSTGIVAVSITAGAPACINNLKANLRYINSFDRVTVFFDADDVGQEWAAKAAELIGPKARIVTGLGYKDANEAWVARDGDAIRRAIDNAGRHIPEGVVQAGDLLDAVLNPEEDRGIDLPWAGWNCATEGTSRVSCGWWQVEPASANRCSPDQWPLIWPVREPRLPISG